MPELNHQQHNNQQLQQLHLIATNSPIVSTNITFSDSQIDELFSISGLFKAIKRKRHKSEVIRLNSLQLCFDDCLELVKNQSISIEDLEKYIKVHHLNVAQIKILRVEYRLKPDEINELITPHVTIDGAITLLKAAQVQHRTAIFR